VLYPRPELTSEDGGGLPILGIDLLKFGGGPGKVRYLLVVDFQPVESPPSLPLPPRVSRSLSSIRSSHPGSTLPYCRMSAKFYDELSFFSEEMLFARFEGEEVEGEEIVQTAFKSVLEDYVDVYMDLVTNGNKPARCGVNGKEEAERVAGRQDAYNAYNRERDPAKGLFSAHFGKEWAEDFVGEFLFPKET